MIVLTCGCHSYVQSLDGHSLPGPGTHAVGSLSFLGTKLPKPAFQSLPKGTKFYTPTHRLAQVQEVDASGRVHVTYVNSRIGGKQEEGVFPLALVKPEHIYKGGTEVQHTCGKGDALLESRATWIYDAVGRKRGA